MPLYISDPIQKVKTGIQDSIFSGSCLVIFTGREF